MKLLGLSCGKKMGNSEILLREALMAAEGLPGTEVELVRLQDLSIQPCTGCLGCLVDMMKGGAGHCFQHKKDDFAFLEDRIYECDAIIISTPVYIMTPTGYFRLMCDRFGPSHDVTLAEASRAMNGGKSEYDDRIFKPRIAGFIAVGGAPADNWTSMALPLMHLFTFPLNIQVVDQMQVLGAGNPGQVLFREAALEGAAKLGRNLGYATGLPVGTAEWMGDDKGTCPVCHSGLLVVGKSSTVECAICGIHGTLKEENGRIDVTFLPEEQEKSRLKLEGKRIHGREIQEVTEQFFAAKDQIPARMKKYRSHDLKIAQPAKRQAGPS